MSHDKHDDPLHALVDSFRSLLDEALVVAIASDYDLSDPSAHKTAEATLKDLSKDVVIEEATEFNPTGTSGVGDENPNGAGVDDGSTSATSASASHQASHAQRTDTSGTDHSSLPADSSESMPKLTSFNDESDEDKVLQLRSMFGELKEFDITHALKKANGDFQTALDDLLNMQYLQSTGQQTRGIDGFFEDDSGPSKGKKKKKKGKKAAQSTVPFEVDSTSKEVLEKNQVKQLKHQDEIAFLADRIYMPYDQVSDIYYRKKCSSGAAAAGILEQYIDLGIQSQDDEGKAKAKELAASHPVVPEKYFLTLVQVTGGSTEPCNDLAVLLTKHFTKNPWTRRLDLSHRITPLPDEDLEGPMGSLTVSAPSSRARTPGSGNPSRPSSMTAMAGLADFSQAYQKANDSYQARSDAHAYAHQLSRRGGASKSLYRQAAVVYRERGHEHAQYAQQMTSTAANMLAEKQSTPSSVDLHGLTVRDGTRIARERVQHWWDNLGEYRTRKAREQPYTVITGLGRHSASGESQLRKAVAAVILQDGWKMQVETGRFVVTGRR